MHVARRPPLRAGARRLLLYARGPQGRRRKADPVSAAHDGNEKDLRPRISKARSRFHGAQRISGQAVFPLFHHSLLHFPMIPRDEFAGKSTNGDWGDCLLMLDHDFGALLDKLDDLKVADNTIVVYCGDNGAEDHLAGRGTGGFFDGSYFSSAEGGIRTPLLIRWPGRIKPGTESNEMVHVTDMFTTLLSFTGCKAPSDRLIDGADQTSFFLGRKEKSDREHCI